MKKSFLLLLLLYCLFSCSTKQRQTDYQIDLILNKSESTIIDDSFPLDSVRFQYSSDSIIMYSDRLNQSFVLMDGNAYQFRKFDGPGFSGETDSILTFSRHDTTFVYESPLWFSIPVTFLGLTSCKYEIKKINKNSYITSKQIFRDTTFTETYYYDNDYMITKYIRTYKDNICVYTY